MRLSIRSKIFLAFVLVQLFAAALIVGWYFFTVRDDLRSIGRSKAENTVLQTIAATKGYFGPPEATARLTQSLLASRVLDRTRPEQLERFFLEQLKLKAYIAGLFVGYPDGAFYYVSRSDEETAGGTRTKFVLVAPDGRTVRLRWHDADLNIVRTADDPEDNYDPRERPWYKAAVEQRKLIWTDPYVFFTARKPGVTAAIPITDAGGGIDAVVGIDIELSAVSRFLVQLGFQSSGSAFILSGNGDVIAHAKENLVFADDQEAGSAPRFRKASELPGVDGAVGGLLTESSSPVPNTDAVTVLEQEFEGEDYYVASESVSDDVWPWRVVAIVRAAGFAGTFDSVNLLLIGVVLFSTGLACFAGYLIAGNVGRSLVGLHHDAELARQGNVELMGELSSGYREIDETHKILRGLAEEKRGLAPRSGPKTPGSV